MMNIKKIIKWSILSLLEFILFPVFSFSQTLPIPSLQEITKNTVELAQYPDGVSNQGGSLKIEQTFSGTYAPTSQGIFGRGRLIIDTSSNAIVTLSGISPSFFGETVIEAGTLQGDISPRSSLNLSGSDATYILNGANQESLSLSGNPGSTINLGANTLTINQNSDTEFAGQVMGSGSLVIADSGALTLSGNNTYQGGTTINAGSTLIGKISSNSRLTLSGSNATYTLTTDQTVPSLTGEEGSIINLGANTFTVGGNGPNTTFRGIIQDGPSGEGGNLVIQGVGGLTLTTQPTYTGSTFTIANLSGPLPLTTALTVEASGIGNPGVYNLTNTQTIGSLAGNGNVTLNGFNLTTGGNNTSTTFSGVISGRGSLTQTGLGSLTLSGNNTYSGGTTINSGSTLIGKIPSNSPLTFSGSNATYTLTTDQTIPSLTGEEGSIINLGNNALTIQNNGKTTFAGNISGEGGSLNLNANLVDLVELTLTGSNTFTGTTFLVPLSTLIGNIITRNGVTSGSISPNSDCRLGDESTLFFNQSLDNQPLEGTFSRSISGQGAVVVSGGSVTFTGSIAPSIRMSTQNGGNITSNTDSIAGDIVNNGSITFNQAAPGTYAGKISGTGSLIKEGTGRVNMTAISSLTGPTTIKKGALAVNGGLENSAVTVNKPGRVEGNGAVGSLSLAGTVAPGNSIGTLTVLNNFTMLPTGSYEAEVNKSGRSDLLNVEGRAFIDGTLDVRTCHCNRSSLKNKVFSILSASGGVVGHFTNLISQDRVKYLAKYLRNGVQVAVTSLQDFVDASSPTSTSNVTRTEGYFDTFADNTAGKPDLTYVINTLDGLLLTENTAAVNNAFNQIQPAQYGDLGGISFLHNELVNKTVSSQQQYLRESRWIDTELRDREEVFANFSPKQLTSFRKLVDDKLLSGFNAFEQLSKNQVAPRANFLVLGGETKAMRPGNQRIRVGKSSLWFQSYGQIEKTKSNHENPSIRSETGGLSLGGDYEVLCNTYVGLLGGLSTTPYHWGQSRGKGRMKSYYGGIYGTWLDPNGSYADGQIIAGGDNFHSERNIKFPGINRTATEDHKAGEFSANAEIGYACALEPFTLQPFLNGTYMFAREQGFTEKRAQSLNFKIKSKTSQFLRGEAGAEIYRTYVLCEALVRPALQLSYIHKHPISGTHVKGGLVGEAQTLTLLGDSRIRNQVAPGLGLTVQFPKGLYIIANVSSQLGSGQNLGDALVRVGYDF